MLRYVAAAGLCALGAAAEAAPSRMTADEMQRIVPGALVEIDTPLGTKIPIRHGTDGRLSGSAGGLGFYLGGERDTGRWWIRRDMLCHKWTRWFDAEEQCMRLERKGTFVRWVREDGKTGTATIASRELLEARNPRYGLGRPAPAPPPARALTSTAPASPAPAAKRTPPQPASKVADAEPRTIVVPPQPQPAVRAQGAGSSAAAAGPREGSRLAAFSPPPHITRSSVETDGLPPAIDEGVAPEPVAGQGTPSVAMATTTRPAAFRVTGVAPYDVLYVRAGPSTAYRPVGEIPSFGRNVRIIGPCIREWCAVRHRNTSGWVNIYYLSEEGTAAPARSVENEPQWRPVGRATAGG